MTPDELRIALENDGWNFGPPLRDCGVSWYAWRKLEGAADCTCNEKPPCLILQPFELEINGKKWHSVEFEVTGEADDRWLKLKAYSVPMGEALASIPRCEQLLRAAWNAAAAMSRSSEADAPSSDSGSNHG